MTEPTVRLTCANWQGDPYYGVHTGPCESDGYVDMPASLEATGEWHTWLLHNPDTLSWSVTMHHCNDPRDHEVNAGNRYHGNVHVMVFCCGPCMLTYLVRMYDDNPNYQSEILVRAAGVQVLVDAVTHGIAQMDEP
jgi:hypothetical protein